MPCRINPHRYGRCWAAVASRLHFMRMVTRSSRPLASITVSVKNPRPVTASSASRLPAAEIDRHAVEQPNEGQRTTLGLDRESAAVDVVEGNFGPIRGEGDLNRRIEVGSRGQILRAAESVAAASAARRRPAAAPRAAPRRVGRGAATSGRRRRTTGGRRRCVRPGRGWRCHRAGRPKPRWYGGRRSQPPRRRENRKRFPSCRRSVPAWRWRARGHGEEYR